MIVIIDYGMGNLGSVANMLKRIGVPCSISADLNVIEKAEKLLLPGVGAFDSAMNSINSRGLLSLLNYKVLEEKTPILGICLGMQLLTEYSEEGLLPGLGWIKGGARKFNFAHTKSNLKVPHMGWNSVKINSDSSLITGLSTDSKFYFVHSYYVTCKSVENSICSTVHGIEFDSIIAKENIYGAQFHPEKSHKYGMRLLENFSRI